MEHNAQKSPFAAIFDLVILPFAFRNIKSMKKLMVQYWLFLGVVSVLLASQGCHWTRSNLERDASAEIDISLGMPVNVIEQNPQIPVRFTLSSDQDGYAEYHEDISHDLIVKSGKLKFVLPSMKSVAMQAVDGKLHYLDDRPSTSLMVLDDAILWTESVIKVLDQSGWKRDADPRMNFYSGELGISFSSIDGLRKAFRENESTRLKRIRVATWRNGKEHVNLEVARIPIFSFSKQIPVENKVYFATIAVALDQ